jgi:hypothetical protein
MITWKYDVPCGLSGSRWLWLTLGQVAVFGGGRKAHTSPALPPPGKASASTIGFSFKLRDSLEFSDLLEQSRYFTRRLVEALTHRPLQKPIHRGRIESAVLTE